MIWLLVAVLALGATAAGVWRLRRHRRRGEERQFHSSFGGSPGVAPVNPYVEARREFNDRYGELARGKRNWQLAALVLTATAGALGFALASVAMQHQVQPYVLEVDEHGAVRVVGDIPSLTPNDAMMRWHLMQWIRNARIVVTDYRAQDQYNELAYATVQGQARTALEAWHRANPPHERAKRGTVLVKAKEPRAISETSYQLRWSEVTYSRSGPSSETEHDAVVRVGVVPPRNQAERETNPLGIRIVNLDW